MESEFSKILPCFLGSDLHDNGFLSSNLKVEKEEYFTWTDEINPSNQSWVSGPDRESRLYCQISVSISFYSEVDTACREAQKSEM